MMRQMWGYTFGDFHQIQAGLEGHLPGLSRRHNAQHFSVGAHQANRRNANLIVDTMRWFDWLRPPDDSENLAIRFFKIKPVPVLLPSNFLANS